MSLLDSFLVIKSIETKVRIFHSKGSKNSPVFFTVEFFINGESFDKTSIVKVDMSIGGFSPHEKLFGMINERIFTYSVQKKYIPPNSHMHRSHIRYTGYDYDLVQSFRDKGIIFDQEHIRVKNKNEL